MGGGKSGGGGTIPHQNELGDMLAGNLMSMSLQRNPAMAGAFGGGTDLSKGFGKMFPGANVGSMTGQSMQTPFMNQARSSMGGGYQPTYAALSSPMAGGGASPRLPAPGTKLMGSYKGAGAYSSVPTGEPGSDQQGEESGGNRGMDFLHTLFGGVSGGASGLLPPNIMGLAGNLGPALGGLFGGGKGGSGAPKNTGTYKGAGALSPIPGGTVPSGAGGKGGGSQDIQPQVDQPAAAPMSAQQAFAMRANPMAAPQQPSPMMGQGRMMGQPPPGWAMAAQHNPNWDRLRAGSMGQGMPQNVNRGGGMYRGAGALAPVPGAAVPTGEPSKALTLPAGGMPAGPMTPPGASSTMGAPGGAMQFQQPTTERIQALTVPQQQYNLLGQVGTQQINRGALDAQQALMRQMASRGLGQSGLAIQGAADLYNRGAGQQMSDFARNLAAQRMGAEFTEAQGARNLEAQRQQNMAGLGLQTQSAQEQANQAARSAALNEALGFGNLGLAEQGQQLGAQNALLQSLTGLGQSNITSYANSAGGKGK